MAGILLALGLTAGLPGAAGAQDRADSAEAALRELALNLSDFFSRTREEIAATQPSFTLSDMRDSGLLVSCQPLAGTSRDELLAALTERSSRSGNVVDPEARQSVDTGNLFVELSYYREDEEIVFQAAIHEQTSTGATQRGRYRARAPLSSLDSDARACVTFESLEGAQSCSVRRSVMLRAAPKNTGGPLRRLRKGTSFNLLASFRDGAAFLVEITGPEGIDGAFERGFLSVSLDRLRDSAAFSCEGLQRERRRLREVFSDCPDGCPQVVVLGAGSVQHGSESHEAGRGADEADLREVRLDEDFAIGMGEVSLGEWRVCVAEGACAPRGEPGMAPDTPVAVSFEDATSFVDWLSARTGAHYFLPSELQWEYAARAGGSTRYHWGDTMEKDAAVCRNCLSDGPPERAEPVHSRSPNLFNLFHMHGNLAEWVADCWDGGGAGGRLAALLPPGAPPPRLGEACPYRVLKGGSFADDALSLRAGNRNFGAVGARDRTVGFRVARSLR